MPKYDRSLYMREFMKEKRNTEKRIKYLLEECNIVGRGNCVHLDLDIQKIFEVSEDVRSDILIGGDYIYLGVKSAIDYYISTVGNKKKLDLIVSIDGAPMYNSKKTSIWPILVTINRKGSYAVAIWHGQGKPNNLDEYFKDFILEIKKLQTNGYKQLLVTIKAFVCDAPARAYVKCIIGHSGYHSCERCMAVGTQKHGVRLLETTTVLCTDMAFKNNFYKEGHQLESLSPLV
ncbi:uncharacterized protein LOC136079489 [Hydra vulgaris]|uniref:Uncharacterized protein LOC136079489 n=1 Tax=Hydra vulgaris TaxID=6087 RepID=A0ABM4BQ99_HYDVU